MSRILDIAFIAVVVMAIWLQVDTWREARKASAFIEAMHELVREDAK